MLTIEEAEEIEKQWAKDWAEKRACDWQHKQHLDSLPTFNEKLKYFLENVSSYPSSTTYTDGENAPFTVGVKPENDEDRRELHRAMMDYHRNELAGRKEPVRKLGWQYSPQDPKPIAFEIQPLVTLKQDLELRLSTAVRKKDLLQRELELTTAKINLADRPVIEELRNVLETNRTYDFAFTDKPFSSPSDKACELAYIWDIVHYEAYIKDELARLKIGPPLTAPSNPATSTSPADEEKIEGSEVTQASLALFYYYCHEKGGLPSFQTGMMKQEYEKAVEPYGLSWKSFQQHYNRMRNKTNRMAPSNRNALLDSIRMLKDYPDALTMAADEYHTAETRKALT